MGIWNINWLFRRISKKKDSGGSRDKNKIRDFPAIMHTKRSKSNASGIERKTTGSIRRRKSRKESKKLQRDPRRQRRTYSFSPGRNDVIQVPADIHRQHPVPPIPNNIAGTNADPNSNDGINFDDGPIDSELKQRNRAASQAKLESQTWERVPTLHKRPGQELNRRKSSKKRKEEHDREIEIRAMSAIMPTKKQPLRMRSDVSLQPPPASLRSTKSAEERHASFKIAALDILTPHPTIRYAENPRYGRTVSSESRRHRVSDRVKASEDVLKSHKRVDDLAEEMDASELREIMERDKRRREKKKIEDQMKMERRLARRKAKQEAEQAQATENGTVPPRNLERGVIGRELEGTEINTPEIPSIKRKGSTASERRRGKRPAEGSGEDKPFDGAHTNEQSNTGALVPERETVAVSPLIPPRVRQQGSATQLTQLDSAATSAPSDKYVKGRHVSEGRPQQSWTSFFKRAKNRRGSSDSPSSFSNTSRDSIPARTEFSTQMPPLPLVRQVSSNAPKRTKSKFREDLPELPISPPDSRLPSPEVDAVPPMHSNYPEKLPAGRGSSESPHSDPSTRRYDTPTSGLVSGHRSLEAPSPEPNAVLSQSLASIGSEGSWLSGRVGGSKRGSMIPHPLRDSASSLQKRYREYSESAEELGIAEDEYFSRLTPGPEEEYKIREDDQLPSSDGEESISSPTKWGAVARQPHLVHHDTRLVKSREGLLHDYINDAPEPLTPIDRKSFGSDDIPTVDSPEAVIGRATSMEISRGPVRQVSNASGRSKMVAEGSQ